MSCHNASDDWVAFISAAGKGRLQDVIELSSKFSNDMKVLGEALTESCLKGRQKVVKWLVENTAANLNCSGDVLIAACVSRQLDLVKYLVQICHADVNLPDRDGDTPLTMACLLVDMPLTVYLLREVKDLNVNIVVTHGNTALHYAVWRSKNDYTQLHEACGYRGDVSEVLKLLYVNGQIINIQDNTGNTPLHTACYYHHTNIIEALMTAGADETITNDIRESAVQWAKRKGLADLQELLDRDSLWQKALLRKNKMYNLAVSYLIMRLKMLVRHKVMSNKWCLTLVIVHILLTVTYTKAEKPKSLKLKKRKCIL